MPQRTSIIRYLTPENAATGTFTPAEQEALAAINDRVAAGASLEAILAFLFDTTRGISPCDRISFAFLEDNGARVVSRHTQCLYEPTLLGNGYAEDLRGSSLSAVLKTGRVRIIDDLGAYLRRKPGSASTRLLVDEGVQSSMTCPLSVDDRPVGFLFRSSRRPAAYDARQAALHFAVAVRLGQAVEKAWRIEQLEAANRAYSEMLGFVSHELKSPLGGIVMDGQLMTDGYMGEMEPRQREKAASIVRKARLLLDMVHDYLDLARLEGGTAGPDIREAEFHADILGPALDMVRPQLDDKGMRITLDLPEPPLPLRCDPRLLHIVMVNLLSNAVKYGNDHGEIRLSARMDAKGFHATVWNEGPGFPESERQRLFRKFSRLQTPALLKQKGTGVGLYTTWQIIQQHGGSIHARSEEGAWAEFSLDLPQ
jgi:signal transduction histidine kinase